MKLRRSISLCRAAVVAASHFSAPLAVASPTGAGTVPSLDSIVDSGTNPFADVIAGRSAGASIPAEQRAYLTQLADAPSQCIHDQSLKNATSPLFGNCYDWHSDVHAHWSLYAASGHTGDVRWAQAAEDDLPMSRLSREANYVSGNAITGNIYENPYGLAWLLRLARERESVTGDAQLRQLADIAVPAMQRQMNGWSDFVWARNAGDSEFQNVSWTLLNMWEWSQFTGDAELVEWVRATSERRLKDPSPDESLPVSIDTATSNRSGYFAPALLRLVTVYAIEGDAARDWVTQRIPAGYHVPAYPNSGTAHANAALPDLGCVARMREPA